LTGGGGALTIKDCALTAVPPRVVMPIGPVVTPPGTSTVRLVADAAVTVAGAPLNVTSFWLVMGSKLAPAIVTTVPAVPLAGANPVMVGDGTVVNRLVKALSGCPLVSLMAE